MIDDGQVSNFLIVAPRAVCLSNSAGHRNAGAGLMTLADTDSTVRGR